MGNSSLTKPALPSSPRSAHSQCETGHQGQHNSPRCLGGNHPSFSTRQTRGSKEESSRKTLVSGLFPNSHLHWHWRKWGNTFRKQLAGNKQWNTQFLKKNTGAGPCISINCEHKRLTISIKHLLPSDFISKFKDNTINHAQSMTTQVITNQSFPDCIRRWTSPVSPATN